VSAPRLAVIDLALQLAQASLRFDGDNVLATSPRFRDAATDLIEHSRALEADVAALLATRDRYEAALREADGLLTDIVNGVPVTKGEAVTVRRDIWEALAAAQEGTP
jgi:hypothetical protein